MKPSITLSKPFQKSIQNRLFRIILQLSREKVELISTMLLAFVFVVFYNSSPMAVSALAIGIAIGLPLLLKKPDYVVFALIVILPFRDVYLISVIHLKRILIWGLFFYLVMRQFTLPRKFFSRQLSLFTRVAIVFVISLFISLLQIISEAQISVYLTDEMLKTLIFSDALVIVEQLLLVYIVYYTIETVSQIYQLLYIILAISACIACLGILQYLIGGPPGQISFLFWPEYKFYGRATSVFPNPNGLGGFLAPLIPLGIVLFFNPQTSWIKRLGFFFPVIILNSCAVFLSYSRMAMVQVLFSLVVIGYLYIAKLSHRKITWKIVVIVLINIGLLISAYQFYERYAQLRVKADIMQPPSLALDRIKAVSDAARIHAAKISFQTFLQHPLFGVGYGGLTGKRILLLGWVENQFLKILAEMGVFGFLPFFLLLVLIVMTGLKIWPKTHRPDRSKEIQFIMALLLVGISTHMFGYLFAESLYNISRTGYLWIFSGIIFSLDAQKEEVPPL